MGLKFARVHTRLILAIVNVAIAAVGIQVVGARVESSPKGARAQSSLADEAVGLEALRLRPIASPSLGLPPRAPAPGVAPIADPKMPIAGKGMWLYVFDDVEGGNPERIVRKAKSLQLTHLYVHSSSSTSGLKWLHEVDRVLPAAHAAGIRVIAWDFPTLRDPERDVRRLVHVLDHKGPGGHRVDGIAVDLETPSEGVNLTAAKAEYMSRRLAQLRPNRFRVLVPPRPSKHTKKFYPYHIIRSYHAVAPMVYWINRHPVTDVRGAMAYLRQFGKPIAPIGQAYDSRAEGGPPGPPAPEMLRWFSTAAREEGAIGVSFWSWQHATPAQLQAIARMPFPSIYVKLPDAKS